MHVPVYSTRVVLKRDGAVLRVLGTIKTVLYMVPIRLRIECSQRMGARKGFQNVCASISNKCLTEKQWCMAILHDQSTVEQGECTLVSPAHGSSLCTRVVHDSLHAEMVRMEMCSANRPTRIRKLPRHTRPSNEKVVTLQRVVDALGITYTESSGALSFHSSFRVPSQCMDVARVLTYGSPSMLAMRDGLRNLWCRSLSDHTCYVVSGDQVAGKM